MHPVLLSRRRELSRELLRDLAVLDRPTPQKACKALVCDAIRLRLVGHSCRQRHYRLSCPGEDPPGRARCVQLERASAAAGSLADEGQGCIWRSTACQQVNLLS